MLSFTDNNGNTEQYAIEELTVEYMEYLLMLGCPGIEVKPNLFAVKNPNDLFAVEAANGDPVTEEHETLEAAFQEFKEYLRNN